MDEIGYVSAPYFIIVINKDKKKNSTKSSRLSHAIARTAKCLFENNGPNWTK